MKNVVSIVQNCIMLDFGGGIFTLTSAFAYHDTVNNALGDASDLNDTAHTLLASLCLVPADTLVLDVI